MAYHADTVVHLATENVLVRGRCKPKDGLREGRPGLLTPCLLLLTLDVSHLVLLVLHVVNQDFLVCSHILHYEVCIGVRQVSARGMSIR